MRRLSLLAALVSMTLALISMTPALRAHASNLTTSDLDADPVAWDGRSVTVVGEVVGDYGRRTEVVWMQLNDDGYVDAPLVETGELAGTNSGLGIRVPRALFEPDTWGRPGGYRTRGPILEITGVFRYADEHTGGDTFIDAAAIDLVSASRPLDAPGPSWPLVFGSLTAIAAGVALGARSRWIRVNPNG